MKNVETLENIESYLKEKLSVLLNIDKEQIPLTADLVNELGADSIVIVQLFVNIQEDFGLDMNESLNLAQSITIKTIAKYIKERI